MDMVHVDNLVEAIFLAMERGKNKNIYYVTDDKPKTVKETLTALLKAKKVTIPDKDIKSESALKFARFSETVWKILRKKNPPPVSLFEVAFMCQPRKYKIDKIKKDLGYKPIVGWEKGLDEMLGLGFVENQ